MLLLTAVLCCTLCCCCCVFADRDQQFSVRGTATSGGRSAGRRFGGHAAMSDRRSPGTVGRVVSQQNPVRTRALSSLLAGAVFIGQVRVISCSFLISRCSVCLFRLREQQSTAGRSYEVRLPSNLHLTVCVCVCACVMSVQESSWQMQSLSYLFCSTALKGLNSWNGKQKCLCIINYNIYCRFNVHLLSY